MPQPFTILIRPTMPKWSEIEIISPINLYNDYILSEKYRDNCNETEQKNAHFLGYLPMYTCLHGADALVPSTIPVSF